MTSPPPLSDAELGAIRERWGITRHYPDRKAGMLKAIDQPIIDIDRLLAEVERLRGVCHGVAEQLDKSLYGDCMFRSTMLQCSEWLKAATPDAPPADPPTSE